MKESLLELSGYFHSRGSNVSCQIAIQLPIPDPKTGDYMCKIRAPKLFAREITIHGVSRGQVIRLAVNYMTVTLASYLMDEDDDEA